MKAIYIKPVTEKVILNTDMSFLWGMFAANGGHSENVGGANKSTIFDFFDDDDDDDHDPFFDD